MKVLNFYNQPFHQAKYGSWVYDASSNFVFQFDEENKFDEKGNYNVGIRELREKILLSINSLDHEPIKELKLTVNPINPIEIFNHGSLYITIRGWGNLTGIGGYNFNEEKAITIQDDFRDWLIYKLSEKATV